MLKHCTATAIEQTRRSRRNIVMGQSDSRVMNDSNDTTVDHLDESMMSCDGGAHGHLNISGATSFLALNSQVRDSRRSSLSSVAAGGNLQSGNSGDQPLSLASRTSSFTSLSNLSTDASSAAVRRTPIKIFAKCLRSDIEYKTLSVSRHTTSTEVIWMLLSKFKMKHRDPKLFYLTMDIGIISHGGSGSGAGDSFTRTLVLEDDAHPAELKSCHPWGECRFTLQMRKGGLVRIHDSVLMAESKYKCLLISDTTTVNEVISILFHCYGLERIERVDRYELCEVGPEGCFEHRLEPSACPVTVQSSWKTDNQFVLKRSAAPAFKTSTLLPSSKSTSLSVSLSSKSPSALSSASGGDASFAVVPMDTSDFSHCSESPIPRSAGSSSVSPTGSVMSNLSNCTSSSDESVTSTGGTPFQPPPLPPPNFSGNRPLPVRPRPSIYGAGTPPTTPLYSQPLPAPPPQLPASVMHKPPLVPNVHPPHLRRTSLQLQPNFSLNSPVTAFPVHKNVAGAQPVPGHLPSGVVPHHQFQFPAIHECGLPESTHIKQTTDKFSSLQEIGPRTRVAFHHYENYFYI